MTDRERAAWSQRGVAVGPMTRRWRNITTAPQDGAPILVHTPGGWGCYVVCWLEGDIDYWHVTDNKFGPYPLRGPGPTHWMPLPESPGGSEGGA